MEKFITKNKSYLTGFLKFMGLKRENIVNGRLENRIKAQKFVYFGKKFGLPLDYDFDLYLYGPYSSKLADDYYNMTKKEWYEGFLNIPEEKKRVLLYLKGLNALDLEIAATLDSIQRRHDLIT